VSHEPNSKDTIFSSHFLIAALNLLPEGCDDGTHHDEL
jgi:hypothetical protein